ncbi:MAG: hypothetical protein HY290_32920 [Planctomycetia bacterium]|nr:hypothetical protein [Planctomycetia bacterium]
MTPETTACEPIAIALDNLLHLEFLEPAINGVFWACLTAAGVERQRDLMKQLWNDDSVIAAVEALQDAHEGRRSVAAPRRALLGKIEEAIQSNAA